jgi:hypothetical protein
MCEAAVIPLTASTNLGSGLKQKKYLPLLSLAEHMTTGRIALE